MTSTSRTASAAGNFRDWSGMPEDLLLTAMAAMQVPDLVHSGAVYHVPLPPPPVAASPAMPAAAIGVVGSAHGWLFTTDRAANPYLLNPLTGARAALPPITTLERVKGRRFVFSPRDGGGRGVAYDVDFGWPGAPDVHQVMARRARQRMYRRVALSASLPRQPPPAAVSSCSCTCRTSSSPSPGRATSAGPRSSDVGFRGEALVHSLDLAGPSSPVSTTLMYTTPPRPCRCNPHIKMTMGRYLSATPHGDLLVAERRWRKSQMTLAGEEERIYDVSTTEIHLLRLDLRRYEQVNLAGGVEDDLALFLGHAAAACLRVEHYPMFRGNCAYLTDDRDQAHPPYKRLDLDVWEFGSNGGGRLTKLRDTWPLHHRWQDNSPAPIWFTPSLD
ncbi:hypothetical protein E2562_014309 [Oryza meyeriana var. granulata]|uniref:KIB1-4 beta-propeller domain-containing protein n=1 Tax=Oryza meyeriana var. granulata TaxID=110450 RepID=A0A6G1C682_9ORYZ|nr:hypothetical protein E2562_014309 [Oryza meyeriana var. granulata]